MKESNEVTNAVSEETQKRTKVELVHAMQQLYTEIATITEDIDAIKEEAKEQGMPASQMARVAKLRAEMKLDDVLEKNEEFAELVNEVENS